MIKRTSPFSDIIINGFPAHRALLAEQSKTFKDLIESLTNDVKELNLPYDNEFVDRLLDLIYYGDYNLDIELYELIQYMNIDIFNESDDDNDLFYNATPDDIRKITERYDLDIKINLAKPTDSDYKFLCCLPHHKYMKIMEPITKEIFQYGIKSISAMIPIIYVTNNLRCLLKWYDEYHWVYSMYNHALTKNINLTQLLNDYNMDSELLHNRKLTNTNMLAMVGSTRTTKSNSLTKRCIDILISLGLDPELLIPIRDSIPK